MLVGVRRFLLVPVLLLAAAAADYQGAIAADASQVAAAGVRPSRLVFGNYCGYGRRFGTLSAPPVDRLDMICKAHDACYLSGRDRCACNAELIAAVRTYRAEGVPDAQALRRAWLVGFAIRAMTPYCHVFPDGLFGRPQEPPLATRRD